MKFRFLLPLFVCIYSAPHAYTGFSTKISTGTTVVYLDVEGGDPDKFSALASAGVEGAIDISDKVYVALEASWLYYNAALGSDWLRAAPQLGGFSFPGALLLLIPVFYPRVGFKVSDRAEITFGHFYVWGLDLGIRTALDNHFTFDANISWLFDRVLLNDGFHDIHILIGFRYRF